MGRAEIPGKRELYLDVSRALAIICITLNHAAGCTYAKNYGQYAEFHRIPVLSTLIKTVAVLFSDLGVPLFLMITGVLILSKKMEDERDIRGFYRRNLLELFIAAEVWFVIMYWCLIFIDPNNTILADEGIWGAVFGMVKTMLFIDQVSFGHMWYMPMILCIYTTIPFLIIIKNKLAHPARVLALPALLVYLYAMVVPAVDSFVQLRGGEPLVNGVREANLFSIYYLYILTGYFVGKGALAKVKGWVLVLVTGLTFGLCCGYQFYAYSRPMDYHITYDFPLLPVVGAGLFELIRRYGHRLRGIRRPVEYLSRISLGIYFVHMLVLSALEYLLEDVGWTRAWRMLYLEVGSVGISILLIAPLSKIPVLRRYVFYIK